METITVEHCPLCNFESSEPFTTLVDQDVTIRYRVCLHCGLVFQSPRMSDQALEAFYSAAYRKFVQGYEGPTAKDIFVQENRALALSGVIRRWIPDPSVLNSHLDIGCSTGILLEVFNRDFDFKPTGIEPGEAYRAYGRSKGLEIYPSLDEMNHARDEGFDLISLIHVLEHLADPVAYLENLKMAFLSPEGYLLLEVPNLYAHNSFEVSHLITFSKHTLRETLQKAGFEVAAIQAHGKPRSKLLPLYITVIAKPVQKDPGNYSVRPERGVRRKRHISMIKRRILERFGSRWAWLPLPDS